MENPNSEQMDNYLFIILAQKLDVFNSYATMLISMVIPAQMITPKSELINLVASYIMLNLQ